ncbi:hypothetical protein [Caballeronia sp. LZ001]|uniref:hypothetical protein n=1 Tax=Caballeronia sp. LZ001 TaxID=3038553 RepID=UPI00285A7D56|nr:hypothetical protein [Caballeronia sp. LZ001]MDR5802150.1 hypothetical protein [Caballeronia sp. LZ001]
MDMSNSSAETWPADAAPEHWVTALFEKMSRMWGNTFLDKWRDVDLAGVKVEWGKGLRRLSNAELKAGVDAMLTLKFPPTLPEFFALCKQMRANETPVAPVLTDQTKAEAAVVQANMRRMRALIADAMAPKERTAEWAYLVLMRSTSRSGSALPFEVIRCATDAISSKEGKLVIDTCEDDELRGAYAKIRAGVLEGYRNAGRKPWETK